MRPLTVATSVSRAYNPDTSLCVGRIGLGPDDPVCADRQQCARYRGLEAHQGESIPLEIWVSTTMRESNDKACEQFRQVAP